MESVVDGIRREGFHAIAVRADVGDEADVQRMAERVADDLGGIDLLVNNAGINREAALFDMALENWEAVLRTNLIGAFLCMRGVSTIIARGGGGVVVNISSVHEYVPWRWFSHYYASKSGLKLLMETAASELAAHKVRMVNVAPGAIDTPMNQGIARGPGGEADCRAAGPDRSDRPRGRGGGLGRERRGELCHRHHDRGGRWHVAPLRTRVALSLRTGDVLDS